jgi:hypothetical protein
MATDPIADAARKIEEAKQRKETADQAFKTGNVKDGTYYAFCSITKTYSQKLFCRITR